MTLTARLLTAGIAVAAALAPGPAARAAEEPQATPQRPSLSFGTTTVPARAFELEVGASAVEAGAALPLFLKYGLTDRVELELGIDAVRWVDTPGEGTTSVGDLVLGARARVASGRRGRALAVGGWIKAPTARDEAGSGEVDATVAGLLSTPLGSLSLDANLVVSALGQADDSTLGQVQGILTLGLPGGAGWSPFVEAAWQTTATQGDGGFFDAGVSYRATPRAVFDVAAGAGWSDGYPDWAVTAGWTVLLDPGR